MPIRVVYTIAYGSVARIGYKPFNSASPYTYLNVFPGPSDSPFEFTGPTTGAWDIEVTEVCPNCSGNRYSAPVLSTVTVP